MRTSSPLPPPHPPHLPPKKCAEQGENQEQSTTAKPANTTSVDGKSGALSSLSESIPIEHSIINLRRLAERMTNNSSTPLRNNANANFSANAKADDIIRPSAASRNIPVAHVLERVNEARRMLSYIQIEMMNRRTKRRAGSAQSQDEVDEEEEHMSKEEDSVLNELNRLVEGACRVAWTEAEELNRRNNGGNGNDVDSWDLIDDIFFSSGKNTNAYSETERGEESRDAELEKDIEVESLSDHLPSHQNSTGEAVDDTATVNVSSSRDHSHENRESGNDVEIMQRDAAEVLQGEIAEMTTQLKASTVAINQKIKKQSKDLDKMEDVAEKNLDRVSKVTNTVTDRVRKGWGKNVAKWTIMSFVLATFSALFLTMRVVPKRRDACLFWCDDERRRRGGRGWGYQREDSYESLRECIMDGLSLKECRTILMKQMQDHSGRRGRQPEQDFYSSQERQSENGSPRRKRGPKQVVTSIPPRDAFYDSDDSEVIAMEEQRARDMAMEKKMQRIADRVAKAEPTRVEDRGSADIKDEL